MVKVSARLSLEPEFFSWPLHKIDYTRTSHTLEYVETTYMQGTSLPGFYFPSSKVLPKSSCRGQIARLVQSGGNLTRQLHTFSQDCTLVHVINKSSINISRGLQIRVSNKNTRYPEIYDTNYYTAIYVIWYDSLRWVPFDCPYPQPINYRFLESQNAKGFTQKG
jgi:hypothetical protein